MPEEHPNPAEPFSGQFQFSLRTLMGFTAAVALLLGMWSWRGEQGVLNYFQGVAVCVVVLGAVQRRIGLVVIGLLVLVGIRVGLSYSIRNSSMGAATCSWHAMKLPVKVVDANTGRPIAAATVRPQAGFRAATAATDFEGYVELDADLPMLIEESGTIVGMISNRWISFESISAMVEAEGYEPAQVWLEQHYGARQDLPGDPLQPIIVKLRREVSVK